MAMVTYIVTGQNSVGPDLYLTFTADNAGSDAKAKEFVQNLSSMMQAEIQFSADNGATFTLVNPTAQGGTLNDTNGVTVTGST